jgi:hypothetical protein
LLCLHEDITKFDIIYVAGVEMTQSS